MFLVVGSFGTKSLGSNMRLVDVLCGRPLFPSSPANFQNVFKNRCFFGSNLFCDSKTWVTNCSFLRLTGFPLLYANFDNLLENRCGQS